MRETVPIEGRRQKLNVLLYKMAGWLGGWLALAVNSVSSAGHQPGHCQAACRCCSSGMPPALWQAAQVDNRDGRGQRQHQRHRKRSPPAPSHTWGQPGRHTYTIADGRGLAAGGAGGESCGHGGSAPAFCACMCQHSRRALSGLRARQTAQRLVQTNSPEVCAGVVRQLQL